MGGGSAAFSQGLKLRLGDSSVRGGGWEGKGGQEVRLSPGSVLSDGGSSQGVRPGGKRPGLRCIQQLVWPEQRLDLGEGRWALGTRTLLSRVSVERPCAHVCTCMCVHTQVSMQK